MLDYVGFKNVVVTSEEEEEIEQENQANSSLSQGKEIFKNFLQNPKLELSVWGFFKFLAWVRDLLLIRLGIWLGFAEFMI